MSHGFICDSLQRLSRAVQFWWVARVDDENNGDSTSAVPLKLGFKTQPWWFRCERKWIQGVALLFFYRFGGATVDEFLVAVGWDERRLVDDGGLVVVLVRRKRKWWGRKEWRWMWGGVSGGWGWIWEMSGGERVRISWGSWLGLSHKRVVPRLVFYSLGDVHSKGFLLGVWEWRRSLKNLKRVCVGWFFLEDFY